MYLRRNIFAGWMAALMLLVANGLCAQEKESCELQSETSGVDVNKIVNTLSKRIKLSGYGHVSFTDYDRTSPRDQFKIVRIIFMADAQVTKHVNAYFMYDFAASSLHEFYLNYKVAPELNIRMGQFKTPFSIENELSPSTVEMVYLYSLPTMYMVTGTCKLMMPACSGRDIGISAFGELFGGKMNYNLAVMNGEGRNKADANSQKDFVMRLGVRPVKWLLLSGSMIKGTGNTAVTASKTSPGEYEATSAPGVTGFKGNGNFQRDRYAAGFCVDTKSLMLRSEYMHGKDADATSNGYYATACIKRVVKNLDLVASYDHLKTYSSKEGRATGGFQYWFYPKCRIQCQYAYDKKEGMKGENCILTQLQVRF